jgi:hypothetical protein
MSGIVQIYTKSLAAIVADVTKAQNSDFIATDFQLEAGGVCRVSLTISSAVKVRLVPSTGSGFYINAGAVLVANAVHTEEIALDVGRTWNIQTDDSGGTDVKHLVVQEVIR